MQAAHTLSELQATQLGSVLQRAQTPLKRTSPVVFTHALQKLGAEQLRQLAGQSTWQVPFPV